MSVGVGAYLTRFRAFGAQPSVERYLDLFHPEGTLFDSGMERPLTVPEIPAHIGAILTALPDFRFEVVRWRARGGTVFAEAHNRATFGGAPFTWPSVYVMTLDGVHVRRGRRYYDRAPLLARVSPEPSPAPPPFLLEAVPDLRMELAEWAGDGELLFIEWVGRGHVEGNPLTLPMVSRVCLEKGVATDGAAFFDSLPLVQALAASR